MAAIAISILILLIGIISLVSLPVEQYPDIAPPTVMVTATYTGADADAVMNSVIMPLEESINGVENMMYISSTAPTPARPPSPFTSTRAPTRIWRPSMCRTVSACFKSTIIPSISIIVSLVGTFAALSVAGFSLNILTLFALVLAIGIVVDDAIIVVEAVQAKYDIGYKSRYLAARDGMADVSMAVITCSIVFMAVFIPVCFMGGTSGVFYTQFGITMATAVGISLISAMTLCPALCAILMKPSEGTLSEKSFNGRIRAAYNASYNAILNKYKKGVMYAIHHRWMVWTSLGVAIVLLVFLMNTTKTGLVPQEDQGTIMVNVGTSPGNSLAETNKVMDQVKAILDETPPR